MKRRKNPIYTGQRKRASTDTGGNRVLVEEFYQRLHELLLSDAEIEIIPPEQVNPTHSVQDQVFIVADYCLRKILPEVTSLFHWGDEVTPRLRALAPIVDRDTAYAAYYAYRDAAHAADVAYNAAAHAAGVASFTAAFETAHAAGVAAADVVRVVVSVVAVFDAHDAAHVVAYAAKCVYNALVAVIEAGDEAAYNRIIALTNEMLESL